MTDMNEPVIGICRFSFCGKGDWRTYSDAKTLADVKEKQTEVAQHLYSAKRMAQRFFLFENFLLPSLKGQSDQNFICLILTSDIMPNVYKNRLRNLCATSPQLELLISPEVTVHAALWPRISSLNEQAGHPLVEFRIDDDDCLSCDYVQGLRRFMNRLEDYTPIAYSRSKGLVATNYAGDGGVRVYDTYLPFNAVGTAARLRGENTVFSYGHHILHRKFPAIVDNYGMGFLSIKVEGHDSLRVTLERPQIRKSHAPIGRRETELALTRWFPYLRPDKGSSYDALIAKLELASALEHVTSIDSAAA